ncbi:helix-turn-helix transcriptional regulator [Paludibacterium paludis]|nr:helix-turn-helix domain-containing protein [Paludibacterium paludis]
MARYLIPPPVKLAPFIRYFHVETGVTGELVVPVTPFPQIGLMLAGNSRVYELDGRLKMEASRTFLTGPSSRPIRLQLSPGAAFISILLRVGQLPRLFPLHCNHLADTSWPLDDVIGVREEAELFSRVMDAPSLGGRISLLGDWLLALAGMREPRGADAFVLPAPRLYLPSDELARQSGLGVRQFERRFLASYGMPLREMRRMLRFVNMLAVLIVRPYAHGRLGFLAQECGYFDQAHMIRDFQLLAGMTPGEFLSATADAGRTELGLMRYAGDERELVFGCRNEEVQIVGFRG